MAVLSSWRRWVSSLCKSAVQAMCSVDWDMAGGRSKVAVEVDVGCVPISNNSSLYITPLAPYGGVIWLVGLRGSWD